MKVPFSGLLGFSTAVRPSPTIRHESRQPLTQPRFGYDGDGDVFVRRREAQKEAAQIKHQVAIREVMDYPRDAFSVQQGQQFLENNLSDSFGTFQSPKVTGEELLNFLVTPDAIDPNSPPASEDAWKRIDFSRVGRTEGELKAFIKQKETDAGQGAIFPLSFHTDAVRSARNKGLVYELSNPNEKGKVYYGVPQNVREQLGLKTHSIEAIKAVPAMTPAQAQFRDALKAFLNNPSVQPGAAGDELLEEYVAQLALSAMAQSDVEAQDIPKALLQHANALGLIAARNYNVLEDLADFAPSSLMKPVADLQRLAKEVNHKPFSVLA